MSSNTSSIPPGPLSHVRATEAHERISKDIDHCHDSNLQQCHLSVPAQPHYTYPYNPGWPYVPQYNTYQLPQLGYLGHPHPFPQPDLRSLQPSLSASQQSGPHAEHETLPNQQQARYNYTLNGDVTAGYFSKSQHPRKCFKSIHPQSGACTRVIRDADSLQSNLDVSFEDVDKDEGFVKDRLPKKIILRESLTRGEKMRLLDLVRQYEEVQRTRGIFLPASKTLKEFYNTVFRRFWDSSSKSYSPVVLRPARHSDLYFEIGHCRQDATSSQPEEEERGPKALKKTIPIFLSLNLEADEIDWRYHDKDGNRFKASDVTLHHGLSIRQAKKNLLDHQDQKETKRICEHNIDQIVHAARRRIVKWAVAGSAAQLGVDDEDKATMEILRLPSERFLARFEEACALRDYLVQRPKPSYKD
ncbi:hypothetical protein FLONG3_1884 [Fusarium longipes]|uniref:Uncharacterized protein n=1 Tax=Fusarium longipes TaxID=694270 RepID=A0A395T5I2_9HYPO|nr:hypothetical protein FLONG3_1884 [Fusarium longipes]